MNEEWNDEVPIEEGVYLLMEDNNKPILKRLRLIKVERLWDNDLTYKTKDSCIFPHKVKGVWKKVL